MGEKIIVLWAKPYIGAEEVRAVTKCFATGWLSMGRRVSEFEDLLSKITGSKYSVAVNSGTAALDIALKLIGVDEKDEVIIPALSYIATGNAVLYQHAIPVFADIDPETYTLSPSSVQKKISSKTKAIIAIDYAGQAADYDALRCIVRKKGILLVEDGAPGLGGKHAGQALCSLGDISITSFHMAKIFTSVEGGALFTRSKRMAEKARIIRSQGENPKLKYHHPILGHNYRMSDIHAAIGVEQIKRFDKVLKKRKELAGRYSEALGNFSQIRIPKVRKGDEHAWFLYPILIPDRDKIALKLKEKGIQTNISWPIPIYEQRHFRKFYKDECPVAKDVTKRVLCLPMYYEMTIKEQDYVIDTLVREIKKI